MARCLRGGRRAGTGLGGDQARLEPWGRSIGLALGGRELPVSLIPKATCAGRGDDRRILGTPSHGHLPTLELREANNAPPKRRGGGGGGRARPPLVQALSETDSRPQTERRRRNPRTEKEPQDFSSKARRPSPTLWEAEASSLRGAGAAPSHPWPESISAGLRTRADVRLRGVPVPPPAGQVVFREPPGAVTGPCVERRTEAAGAWWERQPPSGRAALSAEWLEAPAPPWVTGTCRRSRKGWTPGGWRAGAAGPTAGGSRWPPFRCCLWCCPGSWPGGAGPSRPWL